ncbi:MAG: autotransporter-associated beta strand repeat-containing protein, partial [Kiritimatiellae bacterium]|nr:autotransporter-associated beta strand repeat-containing protein [Kiritimatiellia bacterium]
LALGAADRIDDLSDLIVASGATFAMSNHNEDINSISGVAGSTIAMGAGDLRISGVWTTEFAGVISGEGGQLIHEGTGAGGDEGDLTLSGINTYSGGTVISGGLIRVSADANLGAATGDIWLGAWKSLDFMDSFSVNAGRTLVLCDDDGGHLTVEDTKEVNYLGVITGGGQFNKNGNGRLNLSGNNTYTGPTHLQHGILAFGADANLGTPPDALVTDSFCFTNMPWSTLLMTNNFVDYDIGISLASNRGVFMATNALISVVTNGHLTIDGPITAAPGVSFSKEGDGKLTLRQQLTLGGILCVNAGELELLAPNPLDTTDWVNVGEDTITLPSPAARLSLGPDVVLTNNIAIRTNAVQATGVRTIAMFPSGSAEITGKVDLYQDLDIGATPAGCTLNMSGLIHSVVGEGIWVNKVWGGTVVFKSNLNDFKHLVVLDGVARSGVHGALWEWCDLVITNTGKYDLDTFNLQVAVLAGDGELDLGSGTITITNGYDRTFTGKITGAGTLKKSGGLAVGAVNDRQILAGNNDYTGGTIIDNGSLQINTETNLGTGGITFTNGARLWIAQTSVFDSARSVALAGNGRIDVYTEASADFNGQVTGTGGLAIHDGGRVILNGNNTFSGAVAVNDGILRITHANGLGTTAAGTTVANGAALEISGGITTAAEALTLNGAGDNRPGDYAGGALRNVSGNNTNAGAVSLNTASTIGVDAAGDTLTIGGLITDVTTKNLTKIGAGTLELKANNENDGSLYISDGSVKVASIAAATTVQPLGRVPLVYLGSAGKKGTLTYTGGAGSTTKNMNFPTDGTGVVSVTQGASVMTFSALSEWSGAGEFRKQGAGTLELSPTDGNNVMSGKTFVEAGTLRLVNRQSLGVSPNVDVADGAALELSGDAASYIVGSNITLRGTGGGTGALRALADCVVTARVELASDSTIGASTDYNTDLVLTNTIFGVGALTKTGPGALRLTNGAINTYTGTTTISEGIIAVSRDSSLGTPPSEPTPGHLTINGGELYKQQSGSGSDYSYLAANRGLTIGASHGTVRINGYTYSYAGLIHGSGDLYIDGSGTFALSGDSSGTYSGAITISNGSIRLDGGDVSGGAMAVESGGALRGYGDVGTLAVDGVLAPSNSTVANAKINCTSLDLNDGAEIGVFVTSSGSVTNSMIVVNGTMSVSQTEQITVDLTFLGDTTNYFRNIPIIYHTEGTHAGSPHTNWVVTGAGPLGQFMKVRYKETHSGYYYIQGATPYTDIADGTPSAEDDLEIRILVDTVPDLSYDLIYTDRISWPSNSAASTITWQKLYSKTATESTTIFTNNLVNL